MSAAATHPQAPIGYLDRLSAAPGDSLTLMISSGAAPVSVRFGRLHSTAPCRGSVPGVTPLAAFGEERTVDVGEQATPIGSYVHAPALPGEPAKTLTLAVYAWSRGPATDAREGLVTRWDDTTDSGIALTVEPDGSVGLLRGAEGTINVINTSSRLRPRAWHFVWATYEDGAVTVGHTCLDHWLTADDEVLARGRVVGGAIGTDSEPSWLLGALTLSAAAFSFAGTPAPRLPMGCFNGKLEAPTVWRAVATPAAGARSIDDLNLDDTALEAAWDLGVGASDSAVRDRGPNGLHGTSVNHPARAVRSHGWTGKTVNPREVPDEYAAMYFHADDLTDAQWTPALAIEIPSVPSGVYGAHLQTEHGEDVVPFIITSAADDRPNVAVVLPTFTYLAYANARCLGPDDDLRREAGWPATKDKYEHTLDAHPEYGLSLYDRHADGSEVYYSSLRRPLLTMRHDAKYRAIDGPRHFAADLFLLDWLEENGIAFRVISDHDLHRSAAMLDGADVVLTGSHPEYVSEEILDALEHLVRNGGHLLYLGGNGFESVVAASPASAHIVEIRRGPASGNPSPDTCEIHLSSTGELGGLWRNRGRPPHRLVGVGTTALGQDRHARPFERSPVSFEPANAFAFDGIDPEWPIGRHGFAMGGAAGDELDRAAPEHGTPEPAIVLASAAGFGPSYATVPIDDQQPLSSPPGTPDARLRSDMVLLRHPSGGFVFSVGSVCWIAALPVNGYRNPVARVTHNVLKAALASANERQ